MIIVESDRACSCSRLKPAFCSIPCKDQSYYMKRDRNPSLKLIELIWYESEREAKRLALSIKDVNRKKNTLFFIKYNSYCTAITDSNYHWAAEKQQPRNYSAFSEFLLQKEFNFFYHMNFSLLIFLNAMRKKENHCRCWILKCKATLYKYGAVILSICCRWLLALWCFIIKTTLSAN